MNMGVTSITFTQYNIECDVCGISECCPSSAAEGVRSKQQAIKWADMHKTKDGRVLCDNCFKIHKKRV